MVDENGDPLRDEVDEGFVPTYESNPDHPAKEVVGEPHS